MRELTAEDFALAVARLAGRPLEPDEPIAVAVSGGPDSLALLLLSHAAYGARVRVLTVDHRLRPGSAAEAAAVAAICQGLGLPHATLAWDGEKPTANLQAAAREARYRLMAGWCAANGVAWLCTAHHADDQAETILLRLARGAGLAGLVGARDSRPLGAVTLLRPLLGVRRAALATLVRKAGLKAVDDPANRDPRYDRSHARALLADTAWLDAARLAASAAALAEAEEALAWTAEAAWRGRAMRSGATVALDVAGLPRELCRRLVRRALLEGDPAAALDGPELERLRARRAAGRVATLGAVKARGGAIWRFEPAPPRRAARAPGGIAAARIAVNGFAPMLSAPFRLEVPESMSDQKPRLPNPWAKSLALWVIIALVLVVVWSVFNVPTSNSQVTQLPYSDFLAKVEEGSVREVQITGPDIAGRLTNDQVFRTYAPQDPDLINRLRERGVRFDAKPEEQRSLLSAILINMLPFVLILGIWIFVMRQMQNGAGRGAMGFGKSRAKMLTEKHGRVTFEDVAGIDEAREELEEIVDFLKDPGKFHRLGGKIPKGALLVGPPGTGKTLLARAIAGEANVPFFSISGSDFVEMFVGVGASRVRDMFEQAKKSAPCIIFIDEIDAVGRHRGAGLGGGNDEREQTLNQLLVEMDGFSENEGIIIIAATNRPDVLDPALLRPGRFDRQIVVGRPDIEGREKILAVHMRKLPLAPDVQGRVIARGTPGFSGADLANLVNEAALLAARKGKRLVSMADFEDAKDKVMMGVERKSMIMTDDEKRMTAYHEAGHAVVAMHEPASDPIHKATIIPRGRALGMVMRLPERDSYSFHRDKMYANLSVAMGGRVAEELIFGYDKVSSGASGDIQMATGLARSMVTQWGMSDKLGPLMYADNQEEVFLGHSVSKTQNMSNETAQLIDSEVKRIVIEGYDKAKQVLTDNIDQLHALAGAMLEYETLNGEDIRKVLAGEPIDRGGAAITTGPTLSGGSSIPKTGRRGGGAWGGEPAPQA